MYNCECNGKLKPMGIEKGFAKRYLFKCSSCGKDFKFTDKQMKQFKEVHSLWSAK